MAARTGEQFLKGLQSQPREVWINGERIDDVTEHPFTAGGARSLAGIFDRQHEYADDCLIPDPETAEPIGIANMLPRSVDDLRHRARGLSRLSEYTAGLMGRTPDYMCMKFASFHALHHDWRGDGDRNDEGADNLVAFCKRLARDDISLTHTIIQPNTDKRTDAKIVGNKVTIHKVGETKDSVIVRGARILATLAPFADEISVYPAMPLPPGAEDYALSFTIPMDTPGLKFLCRDSATAVADPFDAPISHRYDEHDAFVIFDDVEIPRDQMYLFGGPGSVDIYNVCTRGMRENMTTQTTIRALNKLEFAYGLGSRMAELIGDYNPATNEMLGELLSYVEVTRNAVFASTEQGFERSSVWFPAGKPLEPMRSLLAAWMPRVNEILILIGSHNLLATPSRRQLDDPDMRPLLDEFMHGADGVDAEERAALFRLVWDFVGSTLGGRNALYERFYLTSAARNRISAHLNNTDKSRAYALVDSILAVGSKLP